MPTLNYHGKQRRKIDSTRRTCQIFGSYGRYRCFLQQLRPQQYSSHDDALVTQNECETQWQQSQYKQFKT